MASPRRDRRTKAQDAYGHPNVSFPTADPAAPVVEEADTVRQSAVLPAFGDAHPDTAKYPTNFLTFQQTSPGDDSDTNLRQKYVPLPGTKLISKLTTEWGPATKTVQPNKKTVPLTITATTADAQSNAVDNVQSEIELTDYDAVPGPWAYAYPIDAETLIGTRVLTRINANGTQGNTTYLGQVAISSATIANPTVITLSAPLPTIDGNVKIAFKDQEWVEITGDTQCTPAINGRWPATFFPDGTHFEIPVNVTAIAGGGPFGNCRIAAPIEKEIQRLNDRQCIEIWSQIDSSSFVIANAVWQAWIQYPWKEVIVGIDTFLDTGASSTGITGSFPTPTQLTWQYGNSIDSNVGIRTARYTGKTLATISRTYSIGPPLPDAVLQIRTSSGEIIMEGFSFTTHEALSIGVSSTGLQTSQSENVKFHTARIEDVLTNGFTSGSLGTDVTLKMNASSPQTFTADATFLAASDVTRGRLNLYLKENTVVKVPNPFPA